MDIAYKLVNIVTEQFAVIDNICHEGIASSAQAILGYNVGEGTAVIKTSMRVELSQNEKLFLIIETACIFEIEEESWMSIHDNSSNTVTIPQNFAAFLAAFAMNTTRGILHAKTEGMSVYSATMLPLMSFETIVKEDIVISCA